MFNQVAGSLPDNICKKAALTNVLGFAVRIEINCISITKRKQYVPKMMPKAKRRLG